MKILIVEDELGISNFLKQGLEEESFVVDVADNGDDGAKMAMTGKYDILLLDWMIPGVSGVEICKQFRQKFSDIPVIFLTAKDTVQETIEGLKSGANDYMKKPFHFDELLERIKVQLRSNNDNVQIELGNIILDISSRQVFKSNQEISLTQKEFDLLAFLIKNKGKVCKRTQIIEQVWDIHFDYDTSVIDVYINALRRKLKLNKEEDYIQTVRGIGYIAKEL